MPKVVSGQVVVKVEGEEGGSGGDEEGEEAEEGGGCGEGERRRDVEDVRGWWVSVQDEAWDEQPEEAQGQHSRHRHSVALLP